MIDLVVDLNLAEVEEQKEEEVLSVSELVLYLAKCIFSDHSFASELWSKPITVEGLFLW